VLDRNLSVRSAPGDDVPERHRRERRQPPKGVLDRDEIRADEEGSQEQGDLTKLRTLLRAVAGLARHPGGRVGNLFGILRMLAISAPGPSGYQAPALGLTVIPRRERLKFCTVSGGTGVIPEILLIAFLTVLTRLLRIIFRSWRDPEFRGLFVLVILLLFGGTLFYSHAEGWGLLDSLYFGVITLPTSVTVTSTRRPT
jgi:hypothetical protein